MSSPTSRCRPRPTATTSSGSPADVVRRIIEFWEEGRTDAVLLLMHPDLEWLEPPESPDRNVVTGREKALGALMMWVASWASHETKLRGITEHGERAIVDYRQRMVGLGSGLEVEGDLYMVWTVRD